MKPTNTNFSHLFNFGIFPGVNRRNDVRVSLDANRVAEATIFVNPTLITKTLGMMAVALVLSSIAVQLIDHATGYNSVVIHKTVKLLNVDLELNIPTFFSTLLLLLSSLLLATIAALEQARREKYALYWGGLSAGFLFMAFDESFSVHERLIEPFRAILGDESLGILYFAWVIPAIVLVISLAFIFGKFVLNLPNKIRFWFIVAAVTYLGAAVGLELLEGRHVEIFGKENLRYLTLATIEEALEMAGIIVFIRALIIYLGSVCEKLHLRFDHDATPE